MLNRDDDRAASCVQVAGPRWPLFGRQTTLNADNYCASVISISAGQHVNGLVAGARDTVYGSEGWGFEHPESARGRCYLSLDPNVVREATICL